MAKNSIGQFIAALRKANGMTQQDVADRLNVSNKAVSRWERDECAPDLSIIPALAEMFGVSCDELLKGERNRENNTFEKKEAKVDKQVKTLINRTLLGFKTLIWMALAVAIIGLISMFGISYGFYSPVIAFAVMLLFEACALAISIVALSRTKGVKTDNELFEMADDTQLEQFNRELGSFSFWTFYIILSVVIISLPFIIVTSDYINSVITPYTYFTVFFGGIVLILALVYFKCKTPYMNWVASGEITLKGKTVNSNKIKWLNVVQIGLTIFAGVLFVFAPYFESSKGDSIWYAVTCNMGLVLLVISIVYFIIVIAKNKEDRKSLFLTGIRNIALLPATLIVANMHSVGWTGIDEEHSFTRIDIWLEEYFFYAITYCCIVFVVFALIGVYLNRTNHKDK